MECAFALGLASGMRYSAEQLTPRKRGMYCADQHFERTGGGVRAGQSGVIATMPLGLRSLTLFRTWGCQGSFLLVSLLLLR